MNNFQQQNQINPGNQGNPGNPGPIGMKLQYQYPQQIVAKHQYINILSPIQIFTELVKNIYEAGTIIENEDADPGKLLKRYNRFVIVQQMLQNNIFQQQIQQLINCITQIAPPVNSSNRRHVYLSRFEQGVHKTTFQFGQQNLTVAQFFYPQFTQQIQNFSVVQFFEYDEPRKPTEQESIIFFITFKDQFDLLKQNYLQSCQQLRQIALQMQSLSQNELYIQDSQILIANHNINQMPTTKIMKELLANRLQIQLINQIGNRQFIVRQNQIQDQQTFQQIDSIRRGQLNYDVLKYYIRRLRQVGIISYDFIPPTPVQQYQQYMLNIKKGFSEILFNIMTPQTRSQYYNQLLDIISRLQDQISKIAQRIQLPAGNNIPLRIHLVLGGGTGQYVSLSQLRQQQAQGNINNDQIFQQLKDAYKVGDLDCKLIINQNLPYSTQKKIIQIVYNLLMNQILNSTVILQRAIEQDLMNNQLGYQFTRNPATQTFTDIRSIPGQPREQYSIALKYLNFQNNVHFSQIDLHLLNNQNNQNAQNDLNNLINQNNPDNTNFIPSITVLRSFYKYTAHFTQNNQNYQFPIKLELIDISFQYSDELAQRIDCSQNLVNLNNPVSIQDCYCVAHQIQNNAQHDRIDKNYIFNIVSQRTFKGRGVQSRKYLNIIVCFVIISFILIVLFVYKPRQKTTSVPQDKQQLVTQI